MDRNVLYVSPGKDPSGPWKVRWENDALAYYYSTKEDALIHARRMVARCPEGFCSEIRLQKSDGTFQSEWTYGRDPFPPKG
jgi:hypothetical protein